MDTNLKPKVSVIICTWNRAAYIKKAAESVLAQSFKDFELLILDDAGTDNTDRVIEEFLKDPRIKYIRNKNNLGISKNRNEGLKMSQGKYIAMLDSDDSWSAPDKLEKQVRFLEDNPEYGLIGTNAIFYDSLGKEIMKTDFARGDKEIRQSILLRNQFIQSGVMFRKKIADSLGGYDEKRNVAEDYDLWLKFGKRSKLANLPDRAVAYLHHERGISKQKRLEICREVKNIVKNNFDYPNYTPALLKSYLRILLAFIGL